MCAKRSTSSRRLQLEDIEAIKILKARYGYYCDDSYNPDGISSLFVEDGRDGSSLYPAGFGVPRRRSFDEALAFHRHLSEDRRIDVPARCPAGNCVTDKIDEYEQRLKTGQYDRWGADGDLAFLIHFVADLHQPLHAANDQDLGGNCVMVESQFRTKNLHAAWDTTIVRRLETKHRFWES